MLRFSCRKNQQEYRSCRAWSPESPQPTAPQNRGSIIAPREKSSSGLPWSMIRKTDVLDLTSGDANAHKWKWEEGVNAFPPPKRPAHKRLHQQTTQHRLMPSIMFCGQAGCYCIKRGDTRKRPRSSKGFINPNKPLNKHNVPNLFTSFGFAWFFIISSMKYYGWLLLFIPNSFVLNVKKKKNALFFLFADTSEFAATTTQPKVPKDISCIYSHQKKTKIIKTFINQPGQRWMRQNWFTIIKNQRNLCMLLPIVSAYCRYAQPLYKHYAEILNIQKFKTTLYPSDFENWKTNSVSGHFYTVPAKFILIQFSSCKE